MHRASRARARCQSTKLAQKYRGFDRSPATLREMLRDYFWIVAIGLELDRAGVVVDDNLPVGLINAQRVTFILVAVTNDQDARPDAGAFHAAKRFGGYELAGVGERRVITRGRRTEVVDRIGRRGEPEFARGVDVQREEEREAENENAAHRHTH